MVKQISKLVTERDSLNGIMLVTSNKELLGISNGIPPGFFKKDYETARTEYLTCPFL